MVKYNGYGKKTDACIMKKTFRLLDDKKHVPYSSTAQLVLYGHGFYISAAINQLESMVSWDHADQTERFLYYFMFGRNWDELWVLTYLCFGCRESWSICRAVALSCSAKYLQRDERSFNSKELRKSLTLIDHSLLTKFSSDFMDKCFPQNEVSLSLQQVVQAQ